MSNAGQALTSVVGAVIGFYVGGPQGAVYGFQLGMMAGSALFPTQLPGVQGPRLGDGQQTTSIVGQPIPWVVAGRQRVGGIIIWASPVREVADTQTQGGKGAPEQSQTTYRYFRSFAVLLCEPPNSLQGEVILGVRRIWANGKLILDRSVPPDVDFGDISDAAADRLLERAAANSNWANRMTFYPGSETQEPDPVIESFEGVGNVPGYRGNCYVVFDDVELRPEDGNRVPAQWSFEVYTAGIAQGVEGAAYSTETLFPWNAGSDLPMNPLNAHIYTAYAGGDDSIPQEDFETLQQALTYFEEQRGRDYQFNTGYSLDPPGTIGGVSNWRIGGPRVTGQLETYDMEDVFLAYNHYSPASYQSFTNICDVPRDDNFHWMPTAGFGHDTEGSLVIWDYDSDDPIEFEDASPSCGGGNTAYASYDVAVRVRRIPSAPASPCFMSIPGTSDYCVTEEGRVIPVAPWVLDESTTYRVLSQYELDDGPINPANDVVVRYPLNPTRPLGHDEYNDQAFWESAYATAVARGQMPQGLVYGVDYPLEQDFGYVIEYSTDIVETFEVSLADIVARICDRAGAKVNLLYDVTDLESIFVIGYQVSRPMPARSAIEPLRPVGYFDAVESGAQIKFVARGKPAVRTLTVDDLGARFAEEERVPNTTSQKKLEFELPRQIRVHYQNDLRNLEPGEEGSPPRTDTKAQSAVDVEIPIAISTDRAAQIAEVMAQDLWLSRYLYVTRTDVSHRDLEPTDCVIVPADGRNERMRIGSAVDMIPNLRVLNLLRDDDGTYVSTATGSEQFIQPPSIEFYGPVISVLLDLPPLDVETDDDAGFYFAARPAIRGGSFRGATLSRSTDGTNFTPVATAADETPMGTLVYDLAAGSTTVFDWVNEVTVVLSNGELESRDMADVLNGANAAAVGANGRWEIIQFLEAEEIGTDVWRLRGLLRGRRGTEWIMEQGQTVGGDAFVMLSLGTIARAPLNVDAVNLEATYRATAVGRPLSTAENFSFTGRGSALRPFSPVHVEGEQDGDDWAFSWVRRDRLATDIDIPMSEEVEDYEVEIMRDGEAIRTISVLTKSATYTAAQQIADFGEVQSSLTIRVYQISAAVGRSYPQQVDLP